MKAKTTAIAVPDPIYLSNSSRTTNASNPCLRRFQLYKINRVPAMTARTQTIHTTLGSSVGDAVVKLAQNPDDLRRAYHTIFHTWAHPEILLNFKLGGKFIGSALKAVKYFQDRMFILRDQGYSLATINNRPAVEVSFRIKFGDYGYYIGFIDAIFQNEKTGKFVVIENKTTLKSVHESLFINSDQDVAYLAVSKLFDNFEGETMYPVLEISANTLSWSVFNFKRTALDFDKFMLSTLLEFKHIKMMQEYDYFPKNGSACNSWGRLCPLYGKCDNHFKIYPRSKREKAMTYDFEIEIEVD